MYYWGVRRESSNFFVLFWFQSTVFFQESPIPPISLIHRPATPYLLNLAEKSEPVGDISSQSNLLSPALEPIQVLDASVFSSSSSGGSKKPQNLRIYSPLPQSTSSSCLKTPEMSLIRRRSLNKANSLKKLPLNNNNNGSFDSAIVSPPVIKTTTPKPPLPSFIKSTSHSNVLCVSTLEAYLSKFSLILDSMLLLRLLLHKLSWDLSLVAKKRQTTSIAATFDLTHRGSTYLNHSGGGKANHQMENRAYSSCSLGNSFK